MTSLRKNNKLGIKRLLWSRFFNTKNYRYSRVSWERIFIMTEFKKIETQEELDVIIKDRLARQKEVFEKQYADYEQIKTRNAELETEVGTLQATIDESKKTNDQTITDLNAKISGYETANLRTKIAVQNGIPLEFADRLVGTDEESLKADAERLSGVFKTPQPTPPLGSTEQTVDTDTKTGAYKEFLENLNLEGE